MSELIQYYNSNTINNTDMLKIYLRHWLTSVIEFDPLTFEPMTTTLVDICQNSLRVINDDEYFKETKRENHDFLYHIATHILGGGLPLLLSMLNTKIVREYEIMPLVNAREFDRTCMQWVARKSGRNLKEKLALDNKVLAVKRKQNYDTTENRLLKVLLKELQYFFDEKKNSFKLSDIENGEQELSEIIESWLTSETAQQIGYWQNLPPNNTLLQHKYYRKTWYAWQFLQRLDDFIKSDERHYQRNAFLVLHIQLLSKLMQYKEVRIAQSPIYVDYENFLIDDFINLRLENKIIKGFLVKNNQEDDYFTLSLHNDSYEVQLFDNNHNIQFFIKCKINKNHQNQLFLFSFSIKDGEWQSALMSSIDELVKQIMSGFNFFVKQKKSTTKTLLVEKAIIDLANTKITVSNEINRLYDLDNLIVQHWQNHNKDDIVFVGNSNALWIDEYVETFSLPYALGLSKDVQTKVIPIMVEYLKDKIECQRISCIVDDKFNDFELQILKQSLNMRFQNSEILPKSIASAFTLLLNKTNNQNATSFLFVNAGSNSVTFTLLKTSINDDLKKLGYQYPVWERYPSDVLNFESNLSEILSNKNKISDKFVDVIINNFNVNEVGASNISLINNDLFQHFELLKIDSRKIKIIERDFKNICDYIENIIQKNLDIKLITCTDNLHIVPKKYQNRLIIVDDIHQGVNFLSEQQQIFAQDTESLWKDHLPYMGIRIKTDLGYAKFDLVNDITISPKRGKKIAITVPNTFILPKNQSFYTFPLYLGDRKQADRYQATLHSPIFPLKQDTECQIELYYSYGAEEPYKLYFIIKDTCKKIQAKWGIVDDANVEYPMPDYPTPITKQELCEFNVRSGYKVNLIRDAKNVFKEIIDLRNHFKRKKRIWGEIKHINEERNFIFLRKDGCEYFLHITDFINEQDICELYQGQTIYFEAIKDKQGRDKAIGASVESDYPTKFYQNKFNEIYTKKIKRAMFSVFMITNDAKLTLDEFSDFKDEYERAIDAILSYQELEDVKINNELKVTFNKLLYCNYAYKSQFVDSVIDNILNDKYEVEIAYLLSDLSQDWQKRIFSCLVDSLTKKPQQPKVYQVLGLAFWRHSDLVLQPSDEQCQVILKGLIDMLDMFVGKSKTKKGNFYAISKYWQLVLALLRLRNRVGLKQTLSPSSADVEKLLDLLIQTEELVKSSGKPFKTYIDFSLDKPKEEKSSDFFYALRLYLTGDDGANAIRIKVNEDE